MAIVGAGLAGIGMAIRLRQRGIEDFVILEREDDLGGTWYVNTYPGCQCDVPSVLYSFSFAPNPDWTRTFAPQPEIEEYIRTCATMYDVKRFIRFSHDVTSLQWDEEGRRWHLETDQGEITADVVVLGTGPLSEPSLPDIPGIETFEGTIFHSAQWRHDHDLTGKRVAAIGTGASSIQFVPQIQPTVEHLDVFQRTPPWIVPRPDRPLAPWERILYRRLPLAQRAVRTGIYWARELMVLAMVKNPRLARPAQRVAAKHLAHQVSDPELRSRLTPSFAFGCKRILLSDDYYPAITQPNVDLVTEPISEVRAGSILTADGMAHEVDTIILGTGFQAAEPPMARKVRGGDGRTMAEHWSDGARAYLGTSVAGFPNLFIITGPNTGLGHTSMIFMMESQFNYIVDAVEQMGASGLRSVDVRGDVVSAYNQRLQSKLARSVWNSGCASWYLDSHGHNTTMWPDFTWRFRLLTRQFDVSQYVTTSS
ncbi:MAG TPA: NAD(P)/FAD-dependent oxidoreductase [Acidimicrobiales bacterium]|nr:NAD(P)/FAD-dependent oxidoreductase [Acidimicrobiales bacterium]